MRATLGYFLFTLLHEAKYMLYRYLYSFYNHKDLYWKIEHVRYSMQAFELVFVGAVIGSSDSQLKGLL